MTDVNETLRADARRNRTRVLEAARSAFTTQGLTASLGEVARRAGVGAGTVYRHFPSKELLFRAVVEGAVRQFTDEAVRLAQSPDAEGAFFGFLHGVVAAAGGDKALREAFGALAEAPYAECATAGTDFDQALGELLTNAQRAGAVRQDVDTADIRALLAGAMLMERCRSAAGGPGRAIAIICDGLRARESSPAAPLPPQQAVVTKPRARRTGGNGTSLGDRNETRSWHCEVCGAPMRPARTGRPPRFCGSACRQKAHRRRARQDVAAPSSAD